MTCLAKYSRLSPSVSEHLKIPDISDQAPSSSILDSSSPVGLLTTIIPPTLALVVSTLDPSSCDQVPIEPSKDPVSFPPADSHVENLKHDTTVLLPQLSERTTGVPNRYGFSTTLACELNHPTYQQAMAGPDCKAWQAAMQDEFDSITKNSVGNLVDSPPGRNIISGMWIFNKKRD